MFYSGNGFWIALGIGRKSIASGDVVFCRAYTKEELGIRYRLCIDGYADSQSVITADA